MRGRLPALALVATVTMSAIACGGDGGTDIAAPATTVAPTTAVPDLGSEPLDACTLVDPGEAEAVVGPGVEPQAENGTSIDGLAYSECRWETDDGSLVAVAVVDSPERYRQHAQRGLGEPVGGLGDEALVATGVSLETSGATGGRTVVVLVGDRSMLVAVKRQGETPVDVVVEQARAVVGRLG